MEPDLLYTEDIAREAVISSHLFSPPEYMDSYCVVRRDPTAGLRCLCGEYVSSKVHTVHKFRSKGRLCTVCEVGKEYHLS